MELVAGALEVSVASRAHEVRNIALIITIALQAKKDNGFFMMPSIIVLVRLFDLAGMHTLVFGTCQSN